MSPFVIVFCACLAACAQAASTLRFNLKDAEEHFERFIQEHNIQYASEEEKQAKFEVFKANLERANTLNAQSKNTEFGITRFMDLSHKEFVKFQTGQNVNFNYTGKCNVVTELQLPKVDAPDSFDWRQQNAVTGVKNQGSECGGCYAFSATGAVESQYAIKHGELLEFSEQQTIDCDKESHGCGGGYTTMAFSYMIDAGGLESATDYPYVAVAQSCKFQASKAKAILTGCTIYDIKSHERLKELVASVGPISIAVKATNFQMYKGGVMDDDVCNAGGNTHSILLVGYGTENGKPYWLAKNSWAESFGEKGYIKFPRGDNYDACGVISNLITTPQVA